MSGLTTLQAIGIFAGIPALIFGLIALPFYLPLALNRMRSRRRAGGRTRRPSSRTDDGAREEQG